MHRMVCSLLLLSAGLHAETGGSLISGVVRNGWSRDPLRRATVTISTTGSDPLEAVTYSDGNGAFAFGGVPPGGYFLCAQYRGYSRACFGGTGEPGRPMPMLIVSPGQNRQDIVISALPMGSVSGTVFDSDGDPVQNASVQMLRAVYERRVLHWENTAQTATNDRGEYRLSFVRPGQYRFMASRPFAPVSRIQPDVTNGETVVEELYGAQFYPNAATVEAASSLTLNAGNDLKGIDFNLAPEPALTISGHVAVPAGAGADETVSLTLSQDTPNGRDQAVSTGAGPPDFAFQFPSVTPGRHRLTAFMKVDGRTYYSSEILESGANAANLTVSLTPGSALTGHLKLEGDGAAELDSYKILLTSANGQPTGVEQPVAEVKPDGSFRFDDIMPGTWDIGVDPEPAGSYIKSMRLGNQDVLTEDMVLKPGNRDPLDIVLSMNGAIVKGVVKESSGADAKAAGRVMVLLAPAGKFENVLSFYEVQASDENGRFTFKRVTPGHYKIYAFDRMERDEYWNPEFLKPYANVGEAFDVPDGARLDRTAFLIVRGESGAQ